MAEGKYFMIRSQLNPDLVLDVEGGVSDPGTKVITYETHGGDNQQWYVDHRTGTIRSKANDLVLDLSDNRLILNSLTSGDGNQQWEVIGEHVCNRMSDSKVLDIVAGESAPGTAVCSWENHGGDNQKWSFDCQEPRYFFIESLLSGKVLDIAGGDPSPGAKVIMWERKDEPEDNQLWYEDRNGVIRSKLNNLVLDGSRGPLEMDNFNPDEHRQWWLVYGERIINRHNHDEVLDVAEQNTENGAEVIPYAWHGGDNQQWKFDYLA